MYIIVLSLEFSINSTGLSLVSYFFIIFSNRGDVWKPGNPLVKALVKALYIVNSALREREQSMQISKAALLASGEISLFSWREFHI